MVYASRKSFSSLYSPKTVAQKQYVEYLRDFNMPLVFAVGPAGSGKTLFACSEAMAQLKKGVVDKIVLTRPTVSVDKEELGFLPGDVSQKMEPWTQPIFDIFQESFSLSELTYMRKQKIIEVIPLAFMRGRTFHHSFVIADEMQNSSPNQMLMLTTRLGKESKMVITGDVEQKDRVVNGLEDILSKLSHSSSPLVGVSHLSSEDIFRSPCVAYILQLYSPGSGSVGSSVSVGSSFTPSPPSSFSSFSSKKKNDDCAIIPLHHMSSRFPKN